MAARASRVIASITVLTVLSARAPAWGQSPWYEGFEGPETSWRDAGGDAPYRIQRHQRVQGEAHTGDGCERLTVVGSQGTYVHVGHDVGRPRVIEDLVASVWIRSDRSGLQIAARLVLPRTEDPRTGRPLKTIVRGSSYTDVSGWQQLRITDMPRRLARQVWALRSQLGPSVDGREAYVESILLNVYGGPGTTNVWIDDLDIAGYVAAPRTSARAASRPGGTQQPDTSQATQPPEGGRIQLVRSVLTVDGTPLFPKIIRHQGEPLALLKQLGFNTVWLGGPATTDQLDQAGRLGLWLVCPPPGPSSRYLPEEPLAGISEIGPQYDCVLAWDLGRGLSARELEATRLWAEKLSVADRRQARPMICLPDTELRDYSWQVDLLLLERQPLGSSLELVNYGHWLRRRPWLAQPATPVWTTVQTQPSASLRRQLAAIDPGRAPPISVPSEQIRLLTYTAVALGSRGLLFDSLSPLDADDPQTRYRAATLELLNLELQLIEPWAAAGSFVATAAGNHAEVNGVVRRYRRTRLLLPMWLAEGDQYVPGQSAANGVWLRVRGVPESSEAFYLAPGGLEPLEDKREAGGTRITFEEFDLVGPVLLAQDALVKSALGQQSNRIARRAAELRRHLAARKLQNTQQIIAELHGGFAAAGQPARWLDAARKQLQSCDGAFAARRYREAYVYAQRAMRTLRLVERTEWEAAIAGLDSPVSSPAAVGFVTLPWHRRLVQQIAASRWGPNLLLGGDFEDLPTMLSYGWSHRQHPSAELHTRAELTPDAAHSGFSGLRLVAEPNGPDGPPAEVETPPVWITTPAIPVEAGQVVGIEGRVQITDAISGSVDGLMIIDSLGGEALAERIRQTSGWRHFTLYRAAPQSGEFTVTFALSGIGEVRLDDVTIHRLQPRRAEVTQRPPSWQAPR